MSTVGYGDVVANTQLEMGYSMIVRHRPALPSTARRPPNLNRIDTGPRLPTMATYHDRQSINCMGAH